MANVDERVVGGSAGKVVWHVTMSFDDSITAFSEKFTEPSALADEIVRTTGAFMVGGRVFRPEDVGLIYGGAWEGEVFVYTRSPRQAPEDAPYRYVTGDIREVVGEVARSRRRQELGGDGRHRARAVRRGGTGRRDRRPRGARPAGGRRALLREPRRAADRPGAGERRARRAGDRLLFPRPEVAAVLSRWT